MTRAKDGDRAALAALCERHAPHVERLARHLLHDPEDARDAAQESLAKLCVRIRQFRGDAQFGTWLHRLVVNTCRDVATRQRSRRCEQLFEDRRIGGDERSCARAFVLSELRSELAGELAAISADQARVVVLKDALDWSFEEISARSGMPVERPSATPTGAELAARAARPMTPTAPFGREVIEEIIPHRDPFLFLDEVLELEPGVRVVARMRVRGDEWFFPGHFPGRPIMPGVIMVEALAQAGAVAALSLEENRGKLALFAGIDDVRFKRIVEPGDELTLTCELEAVRGPIGRGKAGRGSGTSWPYAARSPSRRRPNETGTP